MSIARCVAAALGAVAIACTVAACASTPGRKEALDPVFSVAFSADGRTLAASSLSEEVALFDITPLRFRALLTPEGVKARAVALDMLTLFRSPPIAFSPDGKWLLVGGVSGDIVGWDVDSRMVRFRKAAAGRVTDIAFAPDGRSFFAMAASVQRISIETGEVIAELKPPGGATATALAVSLDGKVVLAGLSSGEIAEYDAATSQLLRVLKGHAVAVTGVAFSPDGSTFASTAGRFDPRLWNRQDDAPLPNRLSDLGGLDASLDRSAREGGGLMLFVWLLGTARGFQIAGAPIMGPPPSGGGPLVAQAAKQSSTMCGPRIVYSPDGRFLATIAHVSMLSGELHLVLADFAQKTARAVHGVYGCSLAFPTIASS